MFDFAVQSSMSGDMSSFFSSCTTEDIEILMIANIMG